YVFRTAGRDQDVVDRIGQPVEELLYRCRVEGVEGGGAARADVPRCLLETLGISADQDDLGALLTRSASSLEADPRAAADQDDGLADQLRLRRGARRGRFGGHGVSFRQLAIGGPLPTGLDAVAISARSAFSASTKISEKVGN